MRRVMTVSGSMRLWPCVAGLALLGCMSSGTEPGTEAGPPTSAAPTVVETAITSSVPAASVPAAAVPATVVESVARPRVFIVGDSTLMAVERYGELDVLRGFDYAFSAESCRTLGVPSCGDPPIPTNAVEAIESAEGPFDVVVVMAGYDEWWTSFPGSFDEVVAAARTQGAEHIVWLNYREGVGYVGPDGSTANEAFVRNNQTLRDKVASGQFPDVALADWYTYSASSTDWLTRDGIHLTRAGARAVADYISRMVAFVSGTPCPEPFEPGEELGPACPNPDVRRPIADLSAVYG